MAENTDLVGAAEIAERSGVTSAAVANWSARHADFPAPVADLRCGRIYSWAEVAEWLARRVVVLSVKVRRGPSVSDAALYAGVYECGPDGVLRPAALLNAEVSGG